MKQLTLLIAGLSLLASCSGDDDNPAPDACALANLAPQSTYNQNNPCAIAVSPNGMIAVSEYNGYQAAALIRIYTSYDNFKNGVVRSSLNATSPEAMAFDADNNLYVSETELVAGIKVFDHVGDGAFAVKKTIQDDFVNPRGLAFDGQGRLFLADDGTGRIIRFDDPFNSNNHATIGSWDQGVKAVAIQGNIMYVANYNTSTVSRNVLKADGTLEIINAGVEFEKATDLSFNGNRVIITSFDTGKMAVLSDCNFGESNMRVYDDLGPTFGTAFVGGDLLGATNNSDKVTQFRIF